MSFLPFANIEYSSCQIYPCLKIHIELDRDIAEIYVYNMFAITYEVSIILRKLLPAISRSILLTIDWVSSTVLHRWKPFCLVWISQWVCLIIRWFELCAHKESLSNLHFVLIILKPFSICILCIIQKRIKFVNFSTTEGKTCSFLRRILTTWCKSVSTKQINEKKLNTLHDQSKALHLEKQQNTTSDALGVDYKNGAGLTKSFYDRPTHVLYTLIEILFSKQWCLIERV